MERESASIAAVMPSIDVAACVSSFTFQFMPDPSSPENERLRAAYAAFNARDVDAALALMTADVAWPRAFKGGFVRGPEEVRAYWTEQWSEIDPHVEPVAFYPEGAGSILVEVHQVVRDLAGNLLADDQVGHRFTLEGGLIQRMEVCELPSADELQIRKVHSTWIDAVNTADLDRLLTLMTDDVVFLNPGEQPLGREEFPAKFSGAHERLRIQCTSELVEVVVGGGVAYTRSKDALTVTPRDGGETMRLAGYRMTVYRKQSDGRWLLARDAHTLSPVTK
jgi:uncharacterized protein (TIGR02246 family)